MTPGPQSLAHPEDLVALIDFASPDGNRQRLAFGIPSCWLVAHELSQVKTIIDAAHAKSQQGHWCVGWVTYEAAQAFDVHLQTHALPPGQALAAFAVFDQAQAWPDTTAHIWNTSPWESTLTPAAFSQQVSAIHELIRAGEVYQINLTSPLSSHLAPALAPTPLSYFQALHRSQPNGYCAYIHAPHLAPSHILSASPELFFQWKAGQITTQPMKGTAARGSHPQEDAQAALQLQGSTKERAENLMIVDLLRNDLSRIATVGSVKVPSLFEVQALPTVWQMTSTVTAQVKPDLQLSDVFAALFPCGSVTGAPKQKAMQHIAKLEGSPRGVYCGAIGLMSPGGEVTFNVPIRTVVLQADESGWQARCGIGSGITLDATANAEANEWVQKQAFLKRASSPFELLESLRLDHGQLPRLELHLQRLRRSAEHFKVDFNEAALRQALERQAQQHPTGVYKVRLLVNQSGQISCTSSPLLPNTKPIQVALASQPMARADEFIWHKTTHRQAYESFAPTAPYFDTLLWNAQGEITEFTIGNVALLMGGRWLTPATHCGLLPGVMRQSLIEQNQLQEAVITLDDLRQAQELVLINSVRGWLPVELTLP